MLAKEKKQGYLYFSKENLKCLEIALAIRSYGATFLPCTFCFLFGKFFEHKDTEEHEMGHFVYVISQTDVHSFFSCTVKDNMKWYKRRHICTNRNIMFR